MHVSPADPHPLVAATAFFSSLGGWVCLAFSLAWIGILIVSVVRSIRKIPDPTVVPERQVEITDGGFRLTGDHPDGTLLHIRYRLAEATHSVRVVYHASPEGHFVPTPGRPQSVSVVVVGKADEIHRD